MLLADDSAEKDADWKEKAQGALDTTVTGAKVVGGVIADKTSAAYDTTKQYFQNNTVGDIASDVGDGVKKVGTGIAEGSKKAWNSFTNLFN